MDALPDVSGPVELPDRRVNSTWVGRTYTVPVPLLDSDEADTAPCFGRMTVTINGIGGRPLEVFVDLGKEGGAASLLADCIGKLVSGWLQDGVPLQRVLKHLIGLKGAYAIRWVATGRTIRSIPDGIGQVLDWHAQQHQKKQESG